MDSKKITYISLGVLSALGLGYFAWTLTKKKPSDESLISKTTPTVEKNKLGLSEAEAMVFVNSIVKSLDSLYRQTTQQNPNEFKTKIDKLVDELYTYGYSYTPPTQYGKSKTTKI